MQILNMKVKLSFLEDQGSKDEHFEILLIFENELLYR